MNSFKFEFFFDRLCQRDVSLSSEIANMEYPAEPDDDEIIQQQPNDEIDSETSSLADEDDSYRILYNAVKSYKLGAQTLIDPFMKLPNRRFHQDYYEEIKRPIAMSLIKNHIQVCSMKVFQFTRERKFEKYLADRNI